MKVIRLKHVLNVLRVLLGGLIGAIVVSTWSMAGIARTYSSRATVLFPLPAETNSVLGSVAAFAMMGRTVPQGSDFSLDSYLALLKSDAIASRVARRCNVRELYSLKTDQQASLLVRRALQVKLNPDRTIQFDVQTHGTPSLKSASDLAHRAASARRDAPYRELAAAIAQAALSEMDTMSKEIKLDRTRAQVDATRQRLNEETGKLEQASRRLTQIQTELSKAGVLDDSAEMGKGLGTIKQGLTETTAALVSAVRQRDAARAQLDDQLRQMKTLPAEFPLLKSTREAFAKAYDTYLEASRKYGPESPEVVNAQAQLEIVQRRLQDESANLKRSGTVPELLDLEARVQALTAERKLYSGLLKEQQAVLGSLPAALQQYRDVKEELALRGKLVAQLSSNLSDAELAYEQRGVRWTVLDAPQVPLLKTGPSNARSLIIGLFFGLLLGGWPLLVQAARSLFVNLPEPGSSAD